MCYAYLMRHIRHFWTHGKFADYLSLTLRRDAQGRVVQNIALGQFKKRMKRIAEGVVR